MLLDFISAAAKGKGLAGQTGTLAGVQATALHLGAAVEGRAVRRMLGLVEPFGPAYSVFGHSQVVRVDHLAGDTTVR